ncbi:MAG TPA: PAS domain S-box protein [Anaeromyxobacteraceae bacterium]|nr:PAS domain S-box protein [Anaeromyxobacteraceae bacterium]
MGYDEREKRRSAAGVLDHGVILLTLLSAGTSAFAALISFQHDDTSALVEAALACAAAIGAAWLGRQASRSARRWHAAEDQAHLAEGKFRSAFTAARFGVLLADREGRVLEANPALQATLGYTADELCALGIADLNRPADRGRALSWLRRLVAGETDAYSDDRWYVRKDGTEAPMSIRASAVRDDAGRFRFLIAIVEDVTEARRTQARLVTAERLAAIGSVAAGLAHDVNNPLCCVKTNLAFALEALDDDARDDGEIRSALADANESVLRVAELMRDLRSFTDGLSDAGGVADVREVVADALAREPHQRPRVVVDVPELPHVPGPSTRLSQIVGSLLRRAADAMPPGEIDRHEIRVVGRNDGPLRVAIEIRDDGPPLPTDAMLHLFEPFRGRPPEGRLGASGLTAALGLVRALGGEVRAENVPGEGNVVSVLLPVAGLRYPRRP